MIGQLALHVTSVLAAGPIMNPAPSSPVSSSGVDLLLGYAKWGSLIACGAAALVSGGLMAVRAPVATGRTPRTGASAPCCGPSAARPWWRSPSPPSTRSSAPSRDGARSEQP